LLVTLGALASIDLHLRNDVSPQGIVSFELCAYLGSCRAIVEAWGPGGRVWAALFATMKFVVLGVTLGWWLLMTVRFGRGSARAVSGGNSR
jgi:hypothetical protein